MLTAGLTGNIASGKSHASHVFAELGARVIDADEIAHQLYCPGTRTYQRVVEAFGQDILGDDATIDRRAFGRVIFHDTDKRMLLNSIVHPEVLKEVTGRIFSLKVRGYEGVVIVDAALLVESGSYKLYDRLIVVKCDPSIQICRLMNRGGLTPEEATERMAAQMSVEEKVKLAHYVIDTDGTYRQTRAQIEAVYRELLQAGVRAEGESEWSSREDGA